MNPSEAINFQFVRIFSKTGQAVSLDHSNDYAARIRDTGATRARNARNLRIN